jgi:hypothetical protein
VYALGGIRKGVSEWVTASHTLLLLPGRGHFKFRVARLCSDLILSRVFSLLGSSLGGGRHILFILSLTMGKPDTDPTLRTLSASPSGSK